jgi:hypothetical protein
MTNEQKPRPTNDIDFQMETIVPHISSEFMSETIKNKFKNLTYQYDETGKLKVDETGNPLIYVKADYWATMELLTQDFRLSNTNKEETAFVRHQLNLTNDILNLLPQEFNKCASISLFRATSCSETSLGKNATLRKLINSFFQNIEHKTNEQKPLQRNWLGLGKKPTQEQHQQNY